jgi:hypothetical protein
VAVVTVAVDRQLGHAGGDVAVVEGREGCDAELFIRPPVRRFDEGWRPRWPQGSEKPIGVQYTWAATQRLNAI